MSTHLKNELNFLKKMLLEISTLAEDSLVKAVKAATDLDPKVAKEVIDQDKRIDALEVELEEDCLKALALYQPVASDLRFIVSVLKINNDLERIGDLACNIAGRTISMSAAPQPIDPPFDLAEMAKITLKMVNDSLKALIIEDTEVAQKVCETDSIVDDIHSETYIRITERIIETPASAPLLIQYLSISRHLERIADYATNIAEDVIYLIDGKIVRHANRT